MPPSDEDRLQPAYQPMASWTCSSPSKFPLASSLCVCRSPLELKIAVSNAVGVPSIRPFMEGASIVSGIAVITQETTFVAGSRRHGRMEAEPLPAHVRTGVYDFHAAGDELASTALCFWTGSGQPRHSDWERAVSKLLVDGVSRVFPGVRGGAPTRALEPARL